MCSGMVAGCFKPLFSINYSIKSFLYVSWKGFSEVDNYIIFFFCIQNIDYVAVTVFQVSFISYLSATFRVKRSKIKYQLVHFAFFFRNHVSVARNFYLSFQGVIPYKFLFSIL